MELCIACAGTDQLKAGHSGTNVLWNAVLFIHKQWVLILMGHSDRTISPDILGGFSCFEIVFIS